MSPRDADLLHLSIEELLEKTARALRVWPRVEAISGITHAYRVGTFSPESGVKSAVYFIARSRDESYSECLDALQTVRSGQPAAVLIPTGRFLPDEARRRLLTAGVPVVELGDLLRLDGRGFVTAADPVELFRWAGKKPPERSGPGSIVARAFVHESGGAGVWEWDLDRGGYEDLLRRRSDFDVFADETTKIVTNRGARSKKAQTVAGSFFTTIRAALEARGEYNPDTAGDASSAKQIFQRARPIFDLKRNGKWELFQTDRTDGHAVYFLNERANTSFAFVFRARK